MLVTLEEAVASVPREGSVYLGNFGSQLFCVGHELIRQGHRRLRLIAGSGGILVDQLIAAGVADEVVVSHCWNPSGPEPAHNFVRAAQEGLSVVELSFGALTAGLTAAAWGVPFLPTTELGATGYVIDERSGGLLDVAHSAYGSVPVVAAIRPDIAFVHADTATPDGNSLLAQPAADTLAAAQAARRVVVVAEEVVPRLAGPADVPGLVVSAVVEHPGAVRPDGCPGRYQRDVSAYRDYAAISSDREASAAWMLADTVGGEHRG